MESQIGRAQLLRLRQHQLPRFPFDRPEDPSDYDLNRNFHLESRADKTRLEALARGFPHLLHEQSGMEQVELEDVKQWVAIRQNRESSESEP
jgi:hypothetical protein